MSARWPAAVWVRGGQGCGVGRSAVDHRARSAAPRAIRACGITQIGAQRLISLGRSIQSGPGIRGERAITSRKRPRKPRDALVATAHHITSSG